MAIGSVALVAASVAVFCAIYAKAGHTSAFLAVARPVQAGQAIERDDLAKVAISPSARLDPIPARDSASVVGLQASVSLVPGSLLTRGEVESAFAPPSGQSIVGVASRPSQMPAAGLAPGEWVSVVLTGQVGKATPVPASGASGPAVQTDVPGSGGAVQGVGTVLASAVPIVDESPAGRLYGADAIVVSLEVPSAVAPLLATASTAGEVALIIVPPPSTPGSVPT
jgi:hypothetical protein